ncbi:MAG: hypothetical protein JWO13_3853 [Acidobacteriales bacterium]|nr:hypothetical protein [Terriglobales bacterium]MEA2616912.1 hypothetical protein [Chloroflexota bacterium]
MADGKKNDATVPIVLIIGGFLLLLLFGGCGQISLPSFNTGSGYSNPPQCDSSRSDCRGHYDGGGHWVPDQNAGGNQRHGSRHEHRRPRPTDDSDH